MVRVGTPFTCQSVSSLRSPPREAGAAVRVGTNEWARSSAAESRGREVQVGGSGLVAVSSGAFVSFDTEGIVFSWVGGILRRGALAFI